MAFSENIIKNMANEIIRNCQVEGVSPEYEFVVYVIQLMLYNPKFGQAGSTNIDRSHLENFVDECVKMLVSSDTPIYTLKMQYTVEANYGILVKLVDKHLDSIEQCLRPLVTEIMDADPEGEAAFMKMYRKISIYVVLASGLGNPAAVVTLKEGMAALESVFSVEDLRVYIDLPRQERLAQLRELVELVSGVRLFNRDCKRGGEGIPDLTFNVLDAGAACQAALAGALAGVTQRVTALTAAAADAVRVDDAGNVVVRPGEGLTCEAYTRAFSLIAFHRQHEAVLRRLAADVAAVARAAAASAERARALLADIHAAVKYKTAVPAHVVYPLFKRLWAVWRSMQNSMYLLATVHRLTSSLAAIQERVPADELVGKGGKEGRQRGGYENVGDRSIQFLGFCAMCLNVGALVPGSSGVGLVSAGGRRYAFCSSQMAKQFNVDPRRYINEVLHHARNNVHLVSLLHLREELAAVRDVRDLVTRPEPKVQVVDRDIQTDTHPHEAYVDKDYTWDMWQWKRRACQWANIVNCRTRSTQTHHSHMRRDAPCQTASPRARAAQTRADAAVNTDRVRVYVTGLRGSGHAYTMTVLDGDAEKTTVKPLKVCPCTVGADGDIDHKTLEIIREMNDKSQ